MLPELPEKAFAIGFGLGGTSSQLVSGWGPLPPYGMDLECVLKSVRPIWAAEMDPGVAKVSIMELLAPKTSPKWSPKSIFLAIG